MKICIFRASNPKDVHHLPCVNSYVTPNLYPFLVHPLPPLPILSSRPFFPRAPPTRAVKSALLSDYVLDLEKRCSGGDGDACEAIAQLDAFARSLEQKRDLRKKAAELLRAAGPPTIATTQSTPAPASAENFAPHFFEHVPIVTRHHVWRDPKFTRFQILFLFTTPNAFDVTHLFDG